MLYELGVLRSYGKNIYQNNIFLNGGSEFALVLTAIVSSNSVAFFYSTKSLRSIPEPSLDSSPESLGFSLEPPGSEPLGALLLVTAVALNEFATAVA